MKTIILITLIYASTGSLCSQVIESLNGHFRVKIVGETTEEGVYWRDQEVSLLQDNKEIWKKIFSADSLRHPYVSNVGEVAIPGIQSIKMYNKSGNIIWVHNLNQGEYIWYWSFSELSQGFSPASDRYYVVCTYSHSEFILCLDRSGRQMWRDTLDYESGPQQITFYKGKVILEFQIPNEKVAFGCYIYDMNNGRIWQQISEKHFSFHFDESTGKLIIKRGPNIVEELDIEHYRAP
jgi:hypothetical protein